MSVQPLLTESVVNLVIAQILSNFDDQLVQSDNQYSDGINLEPLDSNSVSISMDVQKLILPALYVLFGQHAFQYTENSNFMISEDSFVVVLTCEDVGAERLQRKVWRYGRVLYACLNLVDLTDDATPPRLKIRTIPTRLGYQMKVAEKLGAGQKKYRADAVLECKAVHYENYLT